MAKATRNSEKKSAHVKILRVWKDYIEEGFHEEFEKLVNKLTKDDCDVLSACLTSVYQAERRREKKNEEWKTKKEKRQQLVKDITAFVKEQAEKEEDVTWKEVSEKFNIKLGDISDIIDDSNGVLGDVAGVRVGGGIFEFKTAGEHMIEYCGGEEDGEQKKTKTPSRAR